MGRIFIELKESTMQRNQETWHIPGFMWVRHEEFNSIVTKNVIIYFQSIFKNPSVALSGLLALQIFLVLFQLALLVRCTFWYHIVSLTLLLFYNYYTLFKIGRDYLVSLKIYKTEQVMHDKINMHWNLCFISWSVIVTNIIFNYRKRLDQPVMLFTFNMW